MFAIPAIGEGKVRRTVQTWDWDRSVDGPAWWAERLRRLNIDTKEQTEWAVGNF